MLMKKSFMYNCDYNLFTLFYSSRKFYNHAILVMNTGKVIYKYPIKSEYRINIPNDIN